MTRIVSDTIGDYDLVHVSSILKVPQIRQISPGQTQELPPTAKLFFENGIAHSTLLPYEEIRNQWLSLKQAESHPGDRDPDDIPQRAS